jgi:hypothetical protein
MVLEDAGVAVCAPAMEVAEQTVPALAHREIRAPDQKAAERNFDLLCIAGGGAEI